MAKSTSKTFLNGAEAIIREQAAKNGELAVYRGMVPHQEFGRTSEIETIVVGMSDDKDSTKPPLIAVMRVWLDVYGEAVIEFKTGSTNDVTSMCEVDFGLEQVTKLARRLPNL